MAFDTYLNIPEVPGEATAAGMENQIAILSFSLGASNPATLGATATGGGAGQVTLSDFNIMKKTEKSSAGLFKACANGSHYPKATVIMRKAGTTQNEFLKYEFEKVYVTSIQWAGSTGGDDSPTESVSFAYGKVTVTYTPQDDTGAPKGEPQIASWNVQTVSEN